MAGLDLDAACEALAAGAAVVLPNPSPMTYGIVATTPGAVNALKRRPLTQNVAVSVHDSAEWHNIASALDVGPDPLRRIVTLLRRRVSVLAPLRAGHPDWIAAAVRDGYLAIFDGRWSATAPLWDRFPRLYGSSANRTDAAPAATAADAIAEFGADAVVVDGDAMRDPDRRHAASTMVRVTPDGEFTLYRRGAQDAEVGRE